MISAGMCQRVVLMKVMSQAIREMSVAVTREVGRFPTCLGCREDHFLPIRRPVRQGRDSGWGDRFGKSIFAMSRETGIGV